MSEELQKARAAVVSASADMVRLALLADGLARMMEGRPEAGQRAQAQRRAESIARQLRAAAIKYKAQAAVAAPEL